MSTTATPGKHPQAIGPTARPDPAWLARQVPEPVLLPELPIIDPHHHLWQRGGHRYLLDELLADTGDGHRVEATVFIECRAYYNAFDTPALQPVGETEFANGVAAMAHSQQAQHTAARLAEARGLPPRPATRACAGIVGFADLGLGAAVQDVLEAHLCAGNGRFKGIRHAGAWDASPDILNSHTQPPPHLYSEPLFRQGLARLAPLGLVFEAWQYHPQLADVLALARACPDTTVVLNHCGGPLGVGPYAGQQDATYAHWHNMMLALADCPNVVVKLGGLGMRIGLFDWAAQAGPPDSQALAQAYAPWVQACIEAFGAERCMFESNFPVDQYSGSYRTLWNAFKRLASGASPSELQALFSGTARRVYRLAD